LQRGKFYEPEVSQTNACDNSIELGKKRRRKKKTKTKTKKKKELCEKVRHRLGGSGA
jgi:hypothetical protein